MLPIPTIRIEAKIVLDVGEHYISIFLVRGAISVLLAKIAVLKDASVPEPELVAA